MAKSSIPFETMSRANLLAYLQHQAQQIERLTTQNAALQVRVDKLEGQLAKNSSNSSKPPSSDGFKKAAPKSRREKGKRKPGGQVGHQGETLKMVEMPDEIRRHPVTICTHCQHALSEVALERAMKQQRAADDLSPETLKRLATRYDEILVAGFNAFPIQPRSPTPKSGSPSIRSPIC